MDAQFLIEQSSSGEFARQENAFRNWVSPDGSPPYSAVPHRYHVYVSLACREVFAALNEIEKRLVTKLYLFGAHARSVRRGLPWPPQNTTSDASSITLIFKTISWIFINYLASKNITHDQINLTRIVPSGPELDINQPHYRDRF